MRIPDRGVYRSTDGGANWTKTLDHKVNGRAIGAIDIVMDPTNPNVLYAATYDKVRKPWTFGEGGPGSAMFKCADGGAKWTQLTNGLPTGMLGRIGLSIARNAPKTIYAVIENVNAAPNAKVTPEERAQAARAGLRRRLDRRRTASLRRCRRDVAEGVTGRECRRHQRLHRRRPDAAQRQRHHRPHRVVADAAAAGRAAARPTTTARSASIPTTRSTSTC